uniref:Transposase IS204/IS1001/IS1096/IS1165 DDE domain-containing protein n=1 Tax=Amphimedon queenslandica TaxID=400682 RepID=A0A1X7VCT2_AMPQE
MEKEGLVRSVKKLTDYGLNIDILVTDRHRQIAKWIIENLTDVTHYFDVWHVAKEIQKKLLAVAKQKDCEVFGDWTKSIINHLYWCAMSSLSNLPSSPDSI